MSALATRTRNHQTSKLRKLNDALQKVTITEKEVKKTRRSTRTRNQTQTSGKKHTKVLKSVKQIKTKQASKRKLIKKNKKARKGRQSIAPTDKKENEDVVMNDRSTSRLKRASSRIRENKQLSHHKEVVSNKLQRQMKKLEGEILSTVKRTPRAKKAESVKKPRAKKMSTRLGTEAINTLRRKLVENSDKINAQEKKQRQADSSQQKERKTQSKSLKKSSRRITLIHQQIILTKSKPTTRTRKADPSPYKSLDNLMAIRSNMKKRFCLLEYSQSEDKGWQMKLCQCNGPSAVVKLNKIIQCSCFNFRSKKHICEHIRFLFMKVARNEKLMEFYEEKNQLKENAILEMNNCLVKSLRSRIDGKIEKNMQNDCHICYTEMNKKDEVIEECQCKSNFHKKCFDELRRRESCCPICKTKFKPEKEQKESKTIQPANILIKMQELQI